MWVLSLGLLSGSLLPASGEELLSRVQQEKRVVVVNVWATWCRPCVEEFPELLRLRGAWEKEVAFYLVSADFSSRKPQVEQFLQAKGVDFPTYLKVGDDEAFIAALSPEWNGALPATFIFDQQGKLRYFFARKVSFVELNELLKRLVEEGRASTRPRKGVP